MDVFVQVWQQAPRWETSRGSPTAWLMMVTRSRALDSVRRKRRYRAAVARSAEGDGRGLALPVASAGPHPEETMRRRRLHVLLELLPEPQRDVIRLAYFGGMTQTEIASALGIPLGTVKSRIRLAMEALARAVEAEEDAEPRSEVG